MGVLLTSEGVVKSSLIEELRGVLGRNAAAELVPAASPEVTLALRPDIVLRRSSGSDQVRRGRQVSTTLDTT